MNPEDFKKAWLTDEFDAWTELDSDKLAKTDLSDQTKAFLKQGFPEDAAPGLSFGLRSFEGMFHNMNSYPYYSQHALGSIGNDYWLFGSDGAGNPICLDSASQDKVILLNHENGFRPMDSINTHVTELAQCLLVFKLFIDKVNEEFGEDGFFDAMYTTKHVEELKINFRKINIDLFDNSSFWQREFDLLMDEASS